MLSNEMADTLRAEKPDLTENQIQGFVVQYSATVHRVYTMDRFDNVFTGPERHNKCIRWILNNENLFLRYHRALNWKRIKRARDLQKQIAKLQLELALV